MTQPPAQRLPFEWRLGRGIVSIVGAIVVVVGLFFWYGAKEERERVRGRISQIVFVGERVLLHSASDVLFSSEDGGRSWRELADGPDVVSVANDGEIWGAHGWPGHHEGPSADVWRSRDRGTWWRSTDIDVSRHKPELGARLPLLFINEPGDRPLLLMSNYQLVRPELASNPSTWTRVGRPVPALGSPRGTVDPNAAGTQHAGSIYIAVDRSIYLSTDGGMTWKTGDVPGFVTQLRCGSSVCYALADQAGDSRSVVLTAVVGTNEWNGLPAPLTSLNATALVPTETGAYVIGFLAQDRSAVVHVDHVGTISSVGEIPAALWMLEQAPDGTLWAGGYGAYQLQGADWVRVWPKPR